MALSAAEIDDLTKRCKYAQAHGFQIACAEDYARELGYKGGDPPPKVKKFSPAHLLHLLGAASPAPAPKYQASAKFSKAGKAKKAAAAEPTPNQENIPTVPVDIRAVAAAVAEMNAGKTEET